MRRYKVCTATRITRRRPHSHGSTHAGSHFFSAPTVSNQHRSARAESEASTCSGRRHACEACAASLLRCRLAPEEQVHAPALRLCAAATPGPREHFQTNVPVSLQPLTLLPSDLDCGTPKDRVRAAIQVAVPEREHSANARVPRRLRRMTTTKVGSKFLPHPLSPHQTSLPSAVRAQPATA